MTLGKFITIEGIEGVGKSTILGYIKHFLEKHTILHIATREPGGTALAEKIRDIILLHADKSEKLCDDTELLLYFAARAQHLMHTIRPHLAQGIWVVSDRFTDASYAYQGGGRGLSLERIASLEKWVHGDLQPDLTLLLDAPVEVGMSRMAKRETQKDRIEQEKNDFFQRVRDQYLDRARQFPERIKIIDATQDINGVSAQINSLLKQWIDEKSQRV